jgi:hypothetical protein
MATWYVSTAGLSGNTGAIGSPWDLQSAINGTHNASMTAGDTFLLRGGTYHLNNGGTVGVGLLTGAIGASTNPITFKSYAGEWAIIDANTVTTYYSVMYGFYKDNLSGTVFRDLEIRNSNVGNGGGINTHSFSLGNGPGNLARAFNHRAANVSFVNCFIHDTAENMDLWAESYGVSQMYGNIVTAHGYDEPDRGHGHGVYSENNQTPKIIAKNFFGIGYGLGIQCYCEDKTASQLNSFILYGNTCVDNGALATRNNTYAVGAYKLQNLLLGSNTGYPVTNSRVENNRTYCTSPRPPGGVANEFGFNLGGVDNVVINNYFDGTTRFSNWPKVADRSIIAGNTFIDPDGGGFATNAAFPNGGLFTQAGYPSNTYLGAEQGGIVPFVEANAYEAGRAMVTIYNSASASTATVNLDAILNNGDSYWVRNAFNYDAATVANGTYTTGAGVSFPMTTGGGLTMRAPVVGASAPNPWPKFGCFIVRKLATLN